MKTREDTNTRTKLPHPVSLFNVCSVPDQQPHHVLLVPQNCYV